MKRLFYFNITYGCNSSCVFCYSHNTHHSEITYNEISSVGFFQYLTAMNLSPNDRVIINGGEPLLHSEIEKILLGLINFQCEVLIYTNGRLLNQLDFSKLTKQYRFVIPIHGYEEIHDRITRVSGSYRETTYGIASLASNSNILVDIKIIINNHLLTEDRNAKKFIESLDQIQFNNAVHITQMADTIVSVRNRCTSVKKSDAAHYTNLLFEYFKDRNRIIKFFDTCISKINIKDYYSIKKYSDTILVYFKDNNQFREIDLSKKTLFCTDGCTRHDICMSAVDEYKVLEYYNGNIYENLE